MLKLLEYIPDQNYENSLICFPVGMFEVKIEGFQPIHLVVLPNLAKDVSGRGYKFDLKGSTYSRKVLKSRQKYDFKTTLKDLDLVQLLEKKPGMLNFQPRAAQRFLQSLENDSTFLSSLGIMDYSLLLIVEERFNSRVMRNTEISKKVKKQKEFVHQMMQEGNHQAEEQPQTPDMDSAVRSMCGNYTYHFSVIDFLQLYNFQKKGERCAKQVKLCVCRKDQEISSINPDAYRERFMKFCRQSVFMF